MSLPSRMRSSSAPGRNLPEVHSTGLVGIISRWPPSMAASSTLERGALVSMSQRSLRRTRRWSSPIHDSVSVTTRICSASLR